MKTSNTFDKENRKFKIRPPTGKEYSGEEKLKQIQGLANAKLGARPMTPVKFKKSDGFPRKPSIDFSQSRISFKSNKQAKQPPRPKIESINNLASIPIDKDITNFIDGSKNIISGKMKKSYTDKFTSDGFSSQQDKSQTDMSMSKSSNFRIKNDPMINQSFQSRFPNSEGQDLNKSFFKTEQSKFKMKKIPNVDENIEQQKPKEEVINVDRNMAHDIANPDLGVIPSSREIDTGTTMEATLKSTLEYDTQQETIINNILDIKTDAKFSNAYKNVTQKQLSDTYNDILERIITIDEVSDLKSFGMYGFLDSLQKNIQQKSDNQYIMNNSSEKNQIPNNENLHKRIVDDYISDKNQLYTLTNNNHRYFCNSFLEIKNTNQNTKEFLFRCVAPMDSTFQISASRSHNNNTNLIDNYGVNRIIVFQLNENRDSLKILGNNYGSTNLVSCKINNKENEEFFVQIDQDLNAECFADKSKPQEPSVICLNSISNKPLYIEYLQEQSTLIKTDVSKTLLSGILCSYVKYPINKEIFEKNVEKEVFKAKVGEDCCYRYYGEMLGYIAYVYMNEGEKNNLLDIFSQIKMENSSWYFPFKTCNVQKPNSCMIQPQHCYTVVFKFGYDKYCNYNNKIHTKSVYAVEK